MPPRKSARTVPELEAEVARLKAELAALRPSASAVTYNSGLNLGTGRASSIPAGVEEMIVQVDAQDLISFANPPFASLLGAGDRKAMIGQPLKTFDDGALAPQHPGAGG